jgi:hypothetical protein
MLKFFWRSPALTPYLNAKKDTPEQSTAQDASALRATAQTLTRAASHSLFL